MLGIHDFNSKKTKHFLYIKMGTKFFKKTYFFLFVLKKGRRIRKSKSKDEISVT